MAGGLQAIAVQTGCVANALQPVTDLQALQDSYLKGYPCMLHQFTGWQRNLICDGLCFGGHTLSKNKCFVFILDVILTLPHYFPIACLEPRCLTIRPVQQVDLLLQFSLVGLHGFVLPPCELTKPTRSSFLLLLLLLLLLLELPACKNKMKIWYKHKIQVERECWDDCSSFIGHWKSTCCSYVGASWLSGSVRDVLARDCGFHPRLHCRCSDVVLPGKALCSHVHSLDPGISGYLVGQWRLVCLNSSVRRNWQPGCMLPGELRWFMNEHVLWPGGNCAKSGEWRFALDTRL